MPPSNYCTHTSLLSKEVKRVNADVKDTVFADLSPTGGTWLVMAEAM
jgi:hypothetical protein